MIGRWLLKLAGMDDGAVGRIVEARPQIGGGIGMGWVLLLGIVLIGLAVWTYRRTDRLTRGRRAVLTTLRCVLVTLLLVILLRPAVALEVQSTVRRTLLILVDVSSSMRIADPRTDPADIGRALIATGKADPSKGLDTTVAGTVPNTERITLVKDALSNERIKLLPRLMEQFDVRPFVFGQTTRELIDHGSVGADRSDGAWVRTLSANEPATALGDALREALLSVRGQPLAGVVVVTDGANNAGEQPLGAAELAEAEEVPLYVYGVGISAPRDIVVSSVFASDVAFFDDELPVTARIKSRGLGGQSTTLKLELVNRQTGNVEQTTEQSVKLVDGEQSVTLRVTPKTPEAQLVSDPSSADGEKRVQTEYDLRVTAPPREDESVKDNNTASRRVRVIDGKIKVLYIEQSPRWEFRYLQAMLSRDRRMKFKCVLLDADPSISTGEDSPYLPVVPSERKELFSYDLVILGDVAPGALKEKTVNDLVEFVSRFGGGMLMLAGREHNPSSYRGTPLEKLLPVELAIDGAAPVVAGFRPIQLELTNVGKTTAMLELSDVESENVQMWSKLPALFWTAVVERAKPAARVLVVDPSSGRATRLGPMPVVALQQYGSGQVLYWGTDNTWRWRRNGGEELYQRLWGQVVQRLALPHLMGESTRTQLSVDRESYTTGERVRIYARIYTADYMPATDPFVRGAYTANHQSHSLELRPMPDQPGVYGGEFVAAEPGTYRFQTDADAESSVEFVITPPRLEMGETAMQEKLLRQMAAISRGEFVREEDLNGLPEMIKAKERVVRSTVTLELWSHPLYFTLILCVASAEWFIRKRSSLK